jgi:hypothetical protein
MIDRSRKASLEVLTESARERVLRRAAEIDAARGSQVADVRAAAVEAGISSDAFDQAIAELESESTPAVRRPRSRLQRTWLRVSAAIVAALLAFATMRLLAPAPASVAMVEESFALKCLPAGQAAELVRPLVAPNGAVFTRGDDSRIITVRGTGEQLARVQPALDQRDAAACPVPPAR